MESIKAANKRPFQTKQKEQAKVGDRERKTCKYGQKTARVRKPSSCRVFFIEEVAHKKRPKIYVLHVYVGHIVSTYSRSP